MAAAPADIVEIIRTMDDAALLDCLTSIFKVDGVTEKAALNSVHKLVDKLGRAVVKRLSSRSPEAGSDMAQEAGAQLCMPPSSSSGGSTPHAVIDVSAPSLVASPSLSAPQAALDPSRCTVEAMSCVQPRGKFSLHLGESEFRLAGKTELRSKWSNVRCILKFPKPDPYKTDKAGNNQFLLLAFKCGLPHGPKGVPMKAVVIQVDGRKNMELNLASLAGGPGSSYSGTEPEALSGALISATNSVVGGSPWGVCPFFPTQSRHLIQLQI